MGKWVHRLSEIDEETKQGVCANCGVVPLVWHRRWMCSVARKKEHKPRTREQRMQSDRGLHGLTYAEAAEFRRGKVCEICGSDFNLAVDHCHSTGVIRGVLCGNCNRGLGLFKDNTESLQKAIEYLTKGRTSES